MDNLDRFQLFSLYFEITQSVLSGTNSGKNIKMKNERTKASFFIRKLKFLRVFSTFFYTYYFFLTIFIISTIQFCESRILYDRACYLSL